MTEREWKPIETAPRDGTWFMTACSGYDASHFEVGRYRLFTHPAYQEAGGGLYRRVYEIWHEWEGFNNMHRATHWMPLPSPPAPASEEPTHGG